MLLGCGAHALVGPQLPRHLGVGIERLADLRFQRGSVRRKLRGTPIELDERALNFTLVRMLRQAAERKEQNRGDEPDHGPSVRSRA
jgi:hypothetical protein